MKDIKKYPIYRSQGEGLKKEDDYIVVEYPFTLFINGRELITLLCSPKSLRYLALGFLYSEDFIRSMDSIDRLDIDEEKGQAHIYLKEEGKAFQTEKVQNSDSAEETVFYKTIDSFKAKKLERLKDIDLDRIKAFMKDFSSKSETFLLTGGVHSCALYDDSGILIFEEDIGRHNALDKVLGRAFEEGIDLRDKTILSSGRISAEILIKIIKREIPMVVSRSAATSLAIDMAKDLNISLIGFVRGEKLNIYNGNIPSSKA